MPTKKTPRAYVDVTFSDGRTVKFPKRPPSRRTPKQVREVMAREGMAPAMIKRALQVQADAKKKKK